MISRLRAATVVDQYGDTILDWTNPVRLEFPTATAWPAATEESAGPGRAPAVETWQVALPPCADVTFQDRIEMDGRQWEIIGWPQAWKNPFTASWAGTAIKVVRVDG